MLKNNILFLCTGNSCRSQMAEGWVNALLGDRWQARSAGTAPSGYVHPLAIRAMSEVGIDISGGYSKDADEFRHITFDLVITVCDDANEACPVWLREGKVVHSGFDDPAKAEGSEEERMAVFRRVRDEIRQRLPGYLRNTEILEAGTE
ncbi:MAG: arsenate reductase ArsC [Chloroflexi bacterium]|nr:arsenate reductase ArsC [Chloroflexota bacterium]